MQAQPLEFLEQHQLRRQQRRSDPADGIAANLRAPLQAALAADTRRREFTAFAPQVSAIEQGTHLRWREETISNRDAVDPIDTDAHELWGRRFSRCAATFDCRRRRGALPSWAASYGPRSCGPRSCGAHAARSC